ncbi:hypothetical protein NC652_033217 [Populus alba x Populus x berolinensis]|nr:hypothetical protein NC652_033217 [Populus alba x Populus x berolinensis]
MYRIRGNSTMKSHRIQVVDGTNSFPHFHGSSQSFSPLSLDVVIKAEKLVLADGQFSCSLLS